MVIQVIDQREAISEKPSSTIGFEAHQFFKVFVVETFRDLALRNPESLEVFSGDIDSTEFDINSDILPEVR